MLIAKIFYGDLIDILWDLSPPCNFWQICTVLIQINKILSPINKVKRFFKIFINIYYVMPTKV